MEFLYFSLWPGTLERQVAQRVTVITFRILKMTAPSVMGTATTINVYFLNLFNFRIYFVEISILLESTPLSASEESLSVASIARA